MKVAVDKKVHEDAQMFSSAAGLTLSSLYGAAVSEYIANHSPDLITQKLNDYYDNNDSRLDGGLKAAARRVLDGEDW